MICIVLEGLRDEESIAYAWPIPRHSRSELSDNQGEKLPVRLGRREGVTRAEVRPDRRRIFEPSGGWAVLAKLSLYLQKRVERQVPVLHITHHQTRLYLTFRQVLNPQAAAGGAEFWKASAYRIQNDPRPPSQKKDPRELRWPDPQEEWWEQEFVPIQEPAQGIRTVGVLKELRRRHPDVHTRRASFP